ncbi:MAG: HAMP domain-containing protein [Myxococcales bacterium]|nr:HAMP domain-containing protein [Myxococcales bacterium]
MSAPRALTLRSKLTLVFALATLLVVPPSVATIVHLYRLQQINRELAKLDKRYRALGADGGVATRNDIEKRMMALNAREVRVGDAAYRDVITIGTLSVLLLLAITFVLPARIVRPIRRLAALTRQAEGGRLDVPPAEVTPDEIGDLAQRLNRLFADLERFDGLKTARIAELADQRTTLLTALTHNQPGSGAALLDDHDRTVALSQGLRVLLELDDDEEPPVDLVLALGWQDTPLVEDLQERAGVFGGVKLERDGTQYAVTWHRSRTGYKVIVLRPAQ